MKEENALKIPRSPKHRRPSHHLYIWQAQWLCDPVLTKVMPGEVRWESFFLLLNESYQRAIFFFFFFHNLSPQCKLGLIWNNYCGRWTREEKNISASYSASACQGKAGYSVVSGQPSFSADCKQVLIFSWEISASSSQAGNMLGVPRNQSCHFGHQAKELHTSLW